MDNLLLLKIMTSLGGILKQIHSNMYRIDSETQFLSQWKLLSYGDLTLVGENFLA